MCITFGLNHSVGGNCAENVCIVGGALKPRFRPLLRNSLANNDVFSAKGIKNYSHIRFAYDTIIFIGQGLLYILGVFNEN